MSTLVEGRYLLLFKVAVNRSVDNSMNPSTLANAVGRAINTLGLSLFQPPPPYGSNPYITTVEVTAILGENPKEWDINVWFEAHSSIDSDLIDERVMAAWNSLAPDDKQIYSDVVPSHCSGSEARGLLGNWSYILSLGLASTPNYYQVCSEYGAYSPTAGPAQVGLVDSVLTSNVLRSNDPNAVGTNQGTTHVPNPINNNGPFLGLDLSDWTNIGYGVVAIGGGILAIQLIRAFKGGQG